MPQLTVRTGARLHFGLLARGQPGRREFGGLGLMIDRPGFVVRVARADADDLDCGSWTGRVEELLARIRNCSPDASAPRPVRVEIAAAPPAHAGLGSGTQLALALARGLALLAGEGHIAAVELARRAGRGRRSAVGLYGFEHGGLLLEAGRRGPDDISPLAARIETPDPWRFLLIRPTGAAGLSGAEEAGGFARLPPMPQATTDLLCRIALTEIMPAFLERDCHLAGDALGRFGRAAGEYFAPVQGGFLAHEQMRRVASLLDARGLHGFGQSSWGPTLFVLCPDGGFARRLADELAAEPLCADCDLTIAAPLNQGATVEFS